MNNHYYLLAATGFALITLLYYGLLLRIVHHALQQCSFTPARKEKIFRGTWVVLLGWMIVTALLSLSGFLDDFSTMPPRQLMVVFIPLVAWGWIITRPTVNEILKHVPPEKIVGLQNFRIGVEVLLWLCFAGNLLPIQMTFEGRNWDVLSGITAPIVAWLIVKGKASKTLLLCWNIACLLLLINIVVTAVLSMPLPFRVFMNEPANTLVVEFPFIWLPTLLVPLAYGLHFLSLKQLTQR